jgi:RNA polymerase sigma factor (sigma-70 family)
MNRKAGERLIGLIRAAAGGRPAGDASDTELLARYAADRDESAFAELVRRHAGMVLGVARRVLREPQDAEDVCQAAFLLLARRAGGARPGSVAGWLCATARLTALNARKMRARRTRAESGAPAGLSPPTPLDQMTAADLLTAVDEELTRLPDRYRGPLVLCCLEGLARDDAARRLGVTVGTLNVQLDRGRDRLRAALAKRGIELGAVLLAGLVASVAGAAVPTLVASVLAAVMGSPSRTVAALIQGKSVMTTKLLFIGALVAGLAAGSGVMLLNSPSPAAQAVEPQMPKAHPGSAKADGEPPLSKDAAPVEVGGRVLSTDGKPVKGAKLYLGFPRPSTDEIEAPRGEADKRDNERLRQPLATTAEDGTFGFTVTQSDIDRVLLRYGRGGAAVMAVAPGSGPDWAMISGPAKDLTLRVVRDDVPLNGRILDEDGKPVGGVKVRVSSLREGEWGRGKIWDGPMPGQPATVTTAADGRFRVSGLGRDREAVLSVEGETIRHWTISAVTKLGVEKKPGEVRGLPATFEYVAPAGRRIQGVVSDKATGKPVVGVRMTARETSAVSYTDKDGRYEIPGHPKGAEYDVMAQPQNGQLYFSIRKSVTDAPGLEPLKVDFDLVAGVELRGKVTSQATGKAPVRAIVEYYPLYPNEHSRKIADYANAASSAVTGPDGSYRLAVLPGPGVVCVIAGPTNTYAHGHVNPKELQELFKDKKLPENQTILRTAHGDARGAISPERFTALALINPAAGVSPPARDIALLPARTLKGTVVGPDGKPLLGATIEGLEGNMRGDPDLVRGSDFLIQRLSPGLSREIVVEHVEKKLGKAVVVQGDRVDAVEVKLEPLGSATGRLLGKDKKPIAGGKLQLGVSGWVAGELPDKTDGEGRFKVTGLIPGQKYYMMCQHEGLGWKVEFTAETGDSRDLGDLLP